MTLGSENSLPPLHNSVCDGTTASEGKERGVFDSESEGALGVKK